MWGAHGNTGPSSSAVRRASPSTSREAFMVEPRAVRLARAARQHARPVCDARASHGPPPAVATALPPTPRVNTPNRDRCVERQRRAGICTASANRRREVRGGKLRESYRSRSCVAPMRSARRSARASRISPRRSAGAVTSPSSCRGTQVRRERAGRDPCTSTQPFRQQGTSQRARIGASFHRDATEFVGV